MKVVSRVSKSTKTKTKSSSSIFRQKHGIKLGNKRLARLFKDARLKKGLSLEDLALQAGLQTDELQAIESGHRPIPMDYIYFLSNVLGIDPQEVVFIVYDAQRN